MERLNLETYRELLLDVWREACRHIDICESVENICRLLNEKIPVKSLIIQRFDSEVRTIETLAVGHARLESANLVSPSELITGGVESRATQTLEPQNWRKLLSWARGQTAMVVNSAGQLDPQMDWMQLLLIDDLSTPTIVGPLTHAGNPKGSLIMVAEPKAEFNSDALAIAQLLLEPLSIALENDHRFHELRLLREAAEADRRSLLSRLGRQDINEAVVGAETGLKLVMERVELVAKSDVPVLILGETGTGKEVVARGIHTRSKRHAGPFIRVNCGAIPTELIDSQLFGHEKGSFTGASDQRKGWFERAEGGTLFLDEIGELPLAAQVRLLRVLQDHQIERVGGQQPVHVDVRIIAATHRDLASMVKSSTFREDLWYRINVFPILLPRLRERIEDIPALVRHFAQRAAHRFGLPAVEATSTDLSMLMNYSWPGNIRELGAVIDRAAILGNGRTLAVAQSLGLTRPVQPSVPDNEPTFYEVVPESRPPVVPMQIPQENETIIPLDTAMKHHIEKALAATRGQIEGKQGAAAILGINPHTLRARMKKFGLDWSKFRSN